MPLVDAITAEQWATFERQGFVSLGVAVAGAELETLRERIDTIMLRGSDPALGIDCDSMLMQLQVAPGENGPQTGGWKGSTLDYRKIQSVEFDRHYLEYMTSPMYRAVVDGVCPAGEGVSVFRAMFFNKPGRAAQDASGGSVLGWHQDMGAGFNSDRDPLITVYLALDAATLANGCMHIVPASHTEGVLPDRRDDGQEAWREFADARGLEPQPLPLQAGEVVLLSPFLLHTSGTNSTAAARRAFSVELMPEHTRTRDDEILGATILFPGGKEGAVVGKDPALRKRDGGAGEEELRQFAERHAQARL